VDQDIEASTGSHNKKFEEKLFRFLFSYFV